MLGRARLLPSFGDGEGDNGDEEEKEEHAGTFLVSRLSSVLIKQVHMCVIRERFRVTLLMVAHNNTYV